MSSDVGVGVTGQGSPFFPTNAPAPGPVAPTATSPSLGERVAAVADLNREHLRAASDEELTILLQQLLGALKNVPEAQLLLGERHKDGSLRITSHLAVWLIGKVTDANGGGKLVRLSKVPDRESLRSLGGLARLLSTSIAKTSST